jgi:hypothetical protein
MSPGCGQQSGKFVVVRSTETVLLDSYLRIDRFEGSANPRKEASDVSIPLLTFICFQPGMSVKRVDKTFNHRGAGTAMRVALQSDTSNTFSYSIAWNRKVDTLVIFDKTYDRGKGSTFILSGKSGAPSIVQIDHSGPITTKLELAAVLRLVDFSIRQGTDLERCLEAIEPELSENQP